MVGLIESYFRTSEDILNPVPTLISTVRNEGSVFAALAVANFFNKNRTYTEQPGYYKHQFLLDLLTLLKEGNRKTKLQNYSGLY